MKSRFNLFQRDGMFYSVDTVTGKQHSLRTKDKAEALTLLHSKNEAHRQPVLNLQIARTYLSATDPEVARWTWQTAMDELTKTKGDSTRHRHETAMKDKAFDLIRNLPILETQSAHFLKNSECRNGLDKCLPAADSQLRLGHELAAVVHTAQAQMAKK